MGEAWRVYHPSEPLRWVHCWAQGSQCTGVVERMGCAIADGLIQVCCFQSTAIRLHVGSAHPSIVFHGHSQRAAQVLAECEYTLFSLWGIFSWIMFDSWLITAHGTGKSEMQPAVTLSQ